jgi:M6 family metalloprotease-like protein
VSSHKIYQIKTSTTSYNLKSQNANFTGLVTDAMNVAKSDYDFSKIDEILVVMPDKTVTNDLGSAGIQANIDGKIFTESIEGAYLNPSDSNLIHPDWLTHEIGHTFGLIHPNLSGQFNQLSNGLFDSYAWDIMSWDLVPDPGFYAWEKLILGWITPDQVACLTSPPAQPITTYLSAVELPSADTKMLVLRISASQALVIESHRKDEVDPLSSSQEGVLVCKLDVSKGSNEGAISVLYNKPKVSQSNAKFLYGTLSEGDSVMSDGLTITVLKHANGGDYVSISKS